MKEEELGPADTSGGQEPRLSDPNVSEHSDGGEERSLQNCEGDGLSSISDGPNSLNRYMLWLEIDSLKRTRFS